MDLDEFLTASGATGCKLSRYMAQLDPPDLASVRTALQHEAVTSTAIADVLGSHGYEISADVVQRHRRSACACTRRGRFAQLAASAETGDLQ